MGKCLTIVKLVGIGSLGITTGSLSMATFNFLPNLIANNSLTIEEFKSKFDRITTTLRRTVLCFGSLATYLFYTAFKSSAPSGKHPYLIYAALGAPLTFIYYYFNAYPTEDKLLEATGVKPSGKTELKKVKKLIKTNKPTSEEISPLDNSVYNDLGKSSDNEVEEEIEVEVEEEVPVETKITITKSEINTDLETIRTGYLYSGAVSGLAFLFSIIGYLGDNV